MSKAQSSFRLIPVPEDEEGFISADQVEEISGVLQDRDVFMCGPPAMIDSLRAQFTAKGVPAKRLHFERFGFAKLLRS